MVLLRAMEGAYLPPLILMTELISNKRVKLNTFFDGVFKLIVGLGVLWSVFVISGYLFAPKPFEFNIAPETQLTHTLCPGQTFEYMSNIIIRKTPITLVRTDTWFNATMGMTAVSESYATTEIFNWDKSVKAITPRVVKITVPSVTTKGDPIGEGTYRYIVNLNAWGDTNPASIGFIVNVPANCTS